MGKRTRIRALAQGVCVLAACLLHAAAVAAQVAPAPAQTARSPIACAAACGFGTECVAGQCVAICSPACPADQRCSRAGECVSRQTKASEDESSKGREFGT